MFHTAPETPDGPVGALVHLAIPQEAQASRMRLTTLLAQHGLAGEITVPGAITPLEAFELAFPLTTLAAYRDDEGPAGHRVRLDLLTTFGGDEDYRVVRIVDDDPDGTTVARITPVDLITRAAEPTPFLRRDTTAIKRLGETDQSRITETLDELVNRYVAALDLLPLPCVEAVIRRIIERAGGVHPTHLISNYYYLPAPYDRTLSVVEVLVTMLISPAGAAVITVEPVHGHQRGLLAMVNVPTPVDAPHPPADDDAIGWLVFRDVRDFTVSPAPLADQLAALGLADVAEVPPTCTPAEALHHAAADGRVLRRWHEPLVFGAEMIVRTEDISYDGTAYRLVYGVPEGRQRHVAVGTIRLEPGEAPASATLVVQTDERAIATFPPTTQTRIREAFELVSTDYAEALVQLPPHAFNQLLDTVLAAARAVHLTAAGDVSFVPREGHDRAAAAEALVRAIARGHDAHLVLVPVRAGSDLAEHVATTIAAKPTVARTSSGTSEPRHPSPPLT